MIDNIDRPENGVAVADKVVRRRWLIAALAVAALYSVLALRLAFRSRDLIQDDARQHVFWMWRFIDPTLFPNDLIANYFQAVAPAGYKLLYWIFAKVGVNPLFFSKLLPAAIGLLIGYLVFQLFLELMPSPRGAFFASVFLGQLVWLKDDVMSATPRAFVCPLFLAFMFFLVRGRVLLCLLMVAFQALVYPQAGFVALGVLGLRLLKWRNHRPHFTRNRRDYILFFAAVCVFGAAIFPFASSSARFGPVITREQARALPEIQPHGRSQFFVRGLSYWVDAPRSGLVPNGNPPHILALAFLAPVCLLFARRKFRGAVLLQAGLAAVVMWAAAHLFLFRLHLPGRYSQWLFQILFAIGAGTSIAVLWDLAGTWREQLRVKNASPAAIAITLAAVALSAGLLIYPHLKQKFPADSYLAGEPREFFQFLRGQPKDTVVATLRNVGSLIPVFAQRSVLVSAEHAIPYHKGYYDLIRRRGQELVRAYFTANRAELRAFIDKYHIDLIIVSRTPLGARDVKKVHWFGEIAEDVPFDERPALLDFVHNTNVWENNAMIVLDAHRIAQMIQP
jgi:hypothetical protein